MSVEPLALPALALALFSWWMGATGAAVRRRVILLEDRRLDGEDYSRVALFRRLRDDPLALALRIRLSRATATVLLPLGLGLAGATLGWQGAVAGGFLGWFLAAAAEATGGGVLANRLGRAHRGAGYAAWARLAHPGARFVRPLLRRRIRRGGPPEQHALVLAEARATQLPAGGRLGHTERRFLRRLLASTSILVADILTRWDAVTAVEVDTSPAEAASRVLASGRSRLPVLEGDRVVGLVTAKDLLLRVAGPAVDSDVRAFMRPVYFVRQEETMQGLLQELQDARAHLAVVVDRLGRTLGIVTMEDMLEEIVGELHDEREREGETP